MHIQIVHFNLNGFTQSEYEQACESQFAPAFRDVPGLLAKVRLSDPSTNTYGGVYTWRDRAAMDAYFQSPLFQVVASHPNLANLTSRDFEVLEQPTPQQRLRDGGLAAPSPPFSRSLQY
ncbi:MAG: YdhR family protein [Bryobacterales bacterium]|nr:YdhR family protein [Bryobacterales bacterium]